MSESPNFKPTSTENARATTFEEVLRARLSRRSALFGGLGAVMVAACDDDEPGPGTPPGGDAGKDTGPGRDDAAVADTADATDDADGHAPPLSLGFSSVAKSLADALVVPVGYTATVLYRLGDPIAASVGDAKNDGTDAGDSYAQRAGDHHDGMHYFGLGSNGQFDPTKADHALLVMNHEAITPSFLHAHGPTIYGTGNDAVRAIDDEVVKELNCHGVSVVEIIKAGTAWSYRRDSSFNRRVTTTTHIELSGPAARTPYMITKYSPDGSATRGTVNNCANGYTPWGTYLTCEENWAGYFRRTTADNAQRSAKELTSFNRYAVAGTGRELWATASPDDGDRFSRWNAERKGTSSDGGDDYRNVANTYGWIVEIDPFAPSSAPKKRTALGRFAHEGCWVGPVTAGEPLVFYMGCDGRNEYIYKFVSKKAWNPADATLGLAAGDAYLNEGTLYAAEFGEDGTGRWIELRFGVGNVTASNAAYPFADDADVLINARLAADAAKATKMDRPEWGAVHPSTGEVYFTLTNTNAAARPIANVSPANPRFYNDPKGATGSAQKGNPNGHVIRFAEDGAKASATTFRWDVFLFGARAKADRANINISGLSDANDFSSPDGCWFSRATPGLLWLQTDDGAYTDVTNCMLLAALPGRVGDGDKRTITNTDTVTTVLDGGAIEGGTLDGGRETTTTTKTVDTFVGKPLGDANLRRFLVGPKECEITGIAEAPDGKAIFVNIQHPGEETAPKFEDPASFGSHWPDGGGTRPRSATIVITRDDGGVIGV